MQNARNVFYSFYFKFVSFLDKNRFFIFLFILLTLFRFQLSFLNYLDFKYYRFVTVNAKIVNQYKKKNYYVLKLKTKNLSFYTTSREDLKDLLNENVKLTLITSKIPYVDYLFTFYAPSFNLKLLPVDIKDEFIENQHKVRKTGDIFKALFFGESIGYKTRNELSTLGIAHLIALSGLHLGFISVFLYFILSFFYKMFQKKFPYRNRYADLAAVIFVIEFCYLYITGFPPSLIRAFVLEIIVFLYAYNFQNPFSLKVLVTVFVVSLIIFWQKVFTLGYFLSIVGVFYIYLFFRYFKANIFNSLVLSFYMFAVMFIVSHVFFGNFNVYQLFSPFVNIVFSVFYPIEIFLHLFGFGGVFDSVVLHYLHLGDNFVTFKVPLWVGVLFLFLSMVSFFSKKVFYGINLMAIGVILYAIGVYVV